MNCLEKQIESRSFQSQILISSLYRILEINPATDVSKEQSKEIHHVSLSRPRKRSSHSKGRHKTMAGEACLKLTPVWSNRLTNPSWGETGKTVGLLLIDYYE